MVVRRLIELGERKKSDKRKQREHNIKLLLLDWEKAFDKVYQDELVNAVRRMNIPEQMLRGLQTFYDNTRFRIKDMEGKSTWRRQRTGIRQGAHYHHTYW